MGPFVGVAISCMYLVLASLFLEMIELADLELQLLTIGLSDTGGLCVFFRKYTCGVLVLCGDIKNCIVFSLFCLFRDNSFCTLLMFWIRVVV